MPTMAPVPKDDPLMRAWKEFQTSEQFENVKRWVTDPAHTEGSLWGAFQAGFTAATKRAAELHEQVDPASDAERLDRLPGAGAMGAVIEYRDKIRQTIAA